MSASDDFYIMSKGEPVFSEPWEANAFALVVAMHERGVFNWDEWAETLGDTIRVLADGTPYYQCWLAALETLVLKRSILQEQEVAERSKAWEAALAATPHGSPIELSNATVETEFHNPS